MDGWDQDEAESWEANIRHYLSLNELWKAQWWQRAPGPSAEVPSRLPEGLFSRHEDPLDDKASLLYPTGPKLFILEECQARKLRSCSFRGWQVQICVEPLKFFCKASSLLTAVRTVQPVASSEAFLPFSSGSSPLCNGNYASQPPWPGSILRVSWIDKLKSRFLYNSCYISRATAQTVCLWRKTSNRGTARRLFPLHSKFPTLHVTDGIFGNIWVWGLPIPHRAPSLSLGVHSFPFLSLSMQLLLMNADPLSSGLNELWGSLVYLTR